MAARTVASVVSSYLRHLERAGVSADHLANVRRDVCRFQDFLGKDRSVADCRQFDLSAWMATNADRWRSVCTKRNAVSAVLGCFRWAAEEELVERCPFHRPRSLRAIQNVPRRPATEAEYRALLRAGSTPLKRAIFFLWETGARTCELRELRWANVALGPEPKIVMPGKTTRRTGLPRIIALNPVVARFLAWLKRRSTSEFVFVNSDGGKWERRVFARHLRRIAKRVGLDDGVAERVSAYCLRHSFACAAIRAGFSSKIVADQLGHVDSTMVERVYGSHTSQDAAYLSKLAGEIRGKRA